MSLTYHSNLRSLVVNINQVDRELSVGRVKSLNLGRHQSVRGNDLDNHLLLAIVIENVVQRSGYNAVGGDD